MNDKGGRHSLDKAIEILMHEISEYETSILEKTELAILTSRQLYYLGEIYRKENTNVTELAEELSVSKPSVSVIVEKLIREGFVEKAQSETDKRTYYLHLTKNGRKCAIIHDSVYGVFATKVRQILTRKEIIQLASLFDKIIEKLA